MQNSAENEHAPRPGDQVCRSDAVPEGEGREFIYGSGNRAFRLLVVKKAARIYGYHNLCPHFRVPLNHKPDKFVNPARTHIRCAIHYARFRYEDGHCFDGPCEGSRLTPVPLQIIGDSIVVAPAMPAGAGTPPARDLWPAE